MVVLDNLPVHKANGLVELVEAHGARLLSLPPYSPDFTPIKLAFSKLKTHLHTATARTDERFASGTGLDNGKTGLTIVTIMYTDSESALNSRFRLGQIGSDK